jgi:Fe-Mn family superoxide dismutase
MLTRRAAFGLAVALALPRVAAAQAASGPLTLPPLSYPADANEPHIDALTMTIHHGRHHAAYVANANALLANHPQVAAMDVPTMLAKLAELPEAIRTGIRNNVGGHANHTMFWQIMGGKGGAPSGELAAAIDRDLGGMEKFRTDFNGAGLRVFGSGWTFVTVAPDGTLALAARPNQDTPLMQGGRVLMGNDVWEHAYYLKYQNRRADYLAAWWNVLDWQAIAARYAAAKVGTLGV